jgi:hypothetical protein
VENLFWGVFFCESKSAVSQLEVEVQQAKFVDLDLHQRKSKLVPKFRTIIDCLQVYLGPNNNHFVCGEIIESEDDDYEAAMTSPTSATSEWYN